MADLTFDAVMVGGGSKTLITAMYLAKYGGMSVGIFDEQLELGGGWAVDETPAPGFFHNTCSMAQGRYHHLPLWEDFPDFEVKGARFYPLCMPCIFKEDHSSMMFYNRYWDPTQEKTAKTMAQFSERDADTWLTLWQMWLGILRPAFLKRMYTPAPPADQLDALEEMLTNPVLARLIDPHWMILSFVQVANLLFESPEVRFWIYRFGTTWALPIEYPGTGMAVFFLVMSTEADLGVGGSHNLCHACLRVLADYKARTFTKCRVDKILVENGRAVGVRLADGSEVAARKLVVTNVSPSQLVELAGRENLSDTIVRKVNNIIVDFDPELWYGWAMHEAPDYIAAKYNPDINTLAGAVVLGERNPERIIREWRLAHAKTLVRNPVLYAWCFTLADPTQGPPGKHVGGTCAWALPANAMSEREWLKYKEEHAEYVINTWQQYAPNMTWDNIIGYDARTAYDICRLSNMRPGGNPCVIDLFPQQVGKYRPIPELAQHRVPGIEGLYATGSAWPPMASSWSAQAYNCYKIIAEDLNLEKPWQKEGRPF